ncbi:acyl-CoA dehydrogenase [Thermocatellispora tengchongensis]|uniref:Acyl-CoA dehydrogenase n=1 Tax=Thermocatellispora tengchongensis TaxID=1073253 RepID=A0A840PDU7_9ACTN|nr:acyl-CoA dehydrogenase family protein [Thermocatellispora tengchongensis]MBB5135327.1 acyl-CoA dehydrogenase [Thermocatellispora tengchongensis]
MNLLLTPEQGELRAAFRSFLREAAPMAEVRRAMESADGYDRAAYARLNGELGLAGLIVPEEHGGAGAGFADLAVALEETGAALLPGPFLATVFAAIAIRESGDPAAAKEHLPGIAAGSTVATLAPLPGTPATVEAGPGGALSGELTALNGAEAGLLVVAAGERLYAVDPQAGGVTRTPLATLDLTRRQARVRLEAAPARPIGTLGRTPDLVAVALAAEQLGVLRRCLDTIVAYSKIRVTFGRYIGSYQGVKHKLADMHCALEQAESIVRYAAWAADESPADLPEAAALAQAYVGPACFRVARDHLLLHGGIGYTWEHDAHLYYKRAKTDEVLLGPPRGHRARLAGLLGL